jgi:hypothetical protein
MAGPDKTAEEKADLKRRALNVVRHSLGKSVFIRKPDGEIVEAGVLRGNEEYTRPFKEPEWESEDDSGA